MHQEHHSGSSVVSSISNSTVTTLPAIVERPRYSRDTIQSGIVHIGVGGFHRAHQAVYLDDLLGRGGSDAWGICGVGIRAADRLMRDAMSAQDNMYTVLERQGSSSRARVIGAHTSYLFAPEDPERTLEALSAPSTRIVSLTITEGGYFVNDATGELRADDPEIQHDLAAPRAPRTALGYLVEALARRHARGLPPFTVLSCDNLQQNGTLTRRAVIALSALRSPALARFVAEHGAFPNGMVDRITPVTTDADREFLRRQYGVEDKWPVVTELFRQWVIEDHFACGRPSLEDVGVQFTTEVEPYERMKLRLLNASHSALGYLGHLAGFRYIHEIVKDPDFSRFVMGFMDDEVTPLLPPVRGIDLAEYKRSLLTRFGNAAIGDLASRICMDGSAKIPKFVLPSLREQLARGGPISRMTLVLAAWFRYLTGIDESGKTYAIEDPMGAELSAVALRAGRDPRPLLASSGVFGDDLPNDARFVRELSEALVSLHERGARATLRAVLAADRT